MAIAADLVVALVALLHVYFLVLEMFLWTKPIGLKVFGQTREAAEATKVLAGNQGLYNGFLAAGLAWGLVLGENGLAIKVFFLGCVVVAGLYGAVTASRRILFVQALPAAIGLGLLLLAGQAQPTPAEAVLQSEEQRVLTTEDEYVAAEVSRDEAALRRLIDDRFVFNTSDGTTSGKQELIDEVLKMVMVGQAVRERSVLIEGDIAIVSGTADLKFANPGEAETVSSLRYTSTYVKRHGQWRMLALQMQKRDLE
jgi:putative membrane protein